MTQQQCVALLREVRGLERADAAIRQAGASGEWRYVLTAIDWQLRALRYVLSQEHPVLVAAADDLLQQTPEAPAVTTNTLSEWQLAQVPTSRVRH